MKTKRSFISLVLLAALSMSFVASARAQENRGAPGKSVPIAASQQQGPTDPAELESFLDSLLTQELHGISSMAKIVLGLGVLSAVLTVGTLVYTVLAWKNNYWSIAARAYYTLVTVAAVAFVWFLNFWNLLGWRF